MPAVRLDRRRAWVMVAIAKDAATAEAWRESLADEAIEAEVRIDDPARAGIPSRGTAYGLGAVDPVGSMYSYPLYVRAGDRRAARAVLAARADSSGATRIDRSTLLGAVGVVGGTLALVVILLVRG